MQAIIMAGGEGTRLRPLTCNIPKPLAPLCGRPVLEYILELLKKNRINEATLTLMYQGDKIVEYFDDESFKGISLEYSFEDVPLGTAGCVKRACHDDEVLVISGDAMCDFDISSAIEFHKKNKADATIIVKKVSDPREFGLILSNSDGRITGFVEKPSFESCTTDVANTGVYILSKSALDLIPDEKKSDFAMDIFPQMMKREMRLFAYEENGYWCDIGDFRSYLKCQRDMLEGKVSCEIHGHRELDGTISMTTANFHGVKIVPPCFIGRNVSIGAGSVVESGAIICDDVTIGKNSKIHSSVILKGAFLGERVCCNEAIICENAKLLRGASVFEGSVIGEKAEIGENATVEAGVRVWQGKQLDRNSTATYDIKYGNAKAMCLDEDGVCGEINGVVTPQVATTLGSSLASACEKDNCIVAVGFKGDVAGRALALAVISGGMSAGATVWDFGECVEPELAHCMEIIGAEIGCYVDAGVTARLKVISESGLPPTRRQERKIEGGLNRGEFNKVAFSDFGEYKTALDIKSLYEIELLKILPHYLKGVRAEFKTTNNRIAEIMDKIVLPKNDLNGNRIIIHISSDGKKVSAYTEETGYVFHEKLIILASRIAFEGGSNVALPFSFPQIANNIAESYGKKVHRYFNCTCDLSDDEARKEASKSKFVRDGIMLAMVVLSYLSENSLTLEKAIEGIPDFYSTSRFVSVEKAPSQILKQMCKERAGLSEGVVLEEGDSRVLIRPVKTGKGVMMFVESVKSETASELCDKFEKLLKKDY